MEGKIGFKETNCVYIGVFDYLEYIWLEWMDCEAYLRHCMMS